MKSNNIIYSFFIILALLFWNPISYFLIYSNTPIYSIKAIHLFYWIVFISGTLLVIFIQNNMFNDKIKNVLFSISLIGILFSISVIGDRVFGLVTKNDIVKIKNQEGLIFNPNSKARYKTVEFEFIAKINSLGLRDREIDIYKGEMYRILCFGDSWTYGYGVNIEDSWPKKLEEYLLSKGYNNIEVINCGRPGLYTTKYKYYIEKYVPLLKPDLVLVGVLQIDDLAQLFPNKFTNKQELINAGNLKTFARKIKPMIISYLKSSIVNILSHQRSLYVTSTWDDTNTSIIQNYNYWQNIRFYTLNDTVQSLFRSGNLNPGLLDYYINFPDRITIFNDQNHPATKFSAQEMINDFEYMKDICYSHNSNLIFINIPTNYFIGHEVIRTPSDILNSYYETHNNIDPIYRSVAKANDIPYIELTDHFIGLENKSNYLFKYDGHPNAKGYDEMAKYIGKQLIEEKHLIKR